MGRIPTLIGFYAKSSIFFSIINVLGIQFNNNYNTIYLFSNEINLVILIVIGLITSSYSVFYYFKTIKIIFFQNKNNKIAPIFNTHYNILAYNFIGFVFIFNIFGIFLFN